MFLNKVLNLCDYVIYLKNIWILGIVEVKPCIWDILRKFHDLSPDGFQEFPEKNSRYQEKIPYTKSGLLKEINKMHTLLGSLNTTKVVFAHNDLLLGNILTHERHK